MILVIDVGNTNLVFGVYRGQNLLQHWRLSTDQTATEDEYGLLMVQALSISGYDVKEIDGVIISSVVPPLMPVLEKICSRYLQRVPLVVGPGIKTGLNIRYEDPREVGADRIVNAVAAIERYGAPLLVVDFGTATTFDYIDQKGQYIGGAITPGIGISTEALYQKAAKLPRIELAAPKSVIGRNTVQSMQAGIIHGFAGQVDGIVKKVREEYDQNIKVIATGGFADLIAAESTEIDQVDPLLTLHGLRLIYEKNL